jgi:hypothetical protein
MATTSLCIPNLNANCLCHRAVPSQRNNEVLAPIQTLYAPLLARIGDDHPLIITHLTPAGLSQWRGFLLPDATAGRQRDIMKVTTLLDLWRRVDGKTSVPQQFIIRLFVRDYNMNYCWAPLCLLNPFCVFSIGELSKDQRALTALDLEQQPERVECLLPRTGLGLTPHDYGVVGRRTLVDARLLQTRAIALTDLMADQPQGTQRRLDDNAWRQQRRRRRQLPDPVIQHVVTTSITPQTPPATKSAVALALVAVRCQDDPYPADITNMDAVQDRFRLAFSTMPDIGLEDRVRALSDALMALPNILSDKFDTAVSSPGGQATSATSDGVDFFAVDKWVPYVWLHGPYQEYRLEGAVNWSMTPCNVEGTDSQTPIDMWVSMTLLLSLYNKVVSIASRRSQNRRFSRLFASLVKAMDTAFADPIRKLRSGNVAEAVGTPALFTVSGNIPSQRELQLQEERAADEELVDAQLEDIENLAVAKAGALLSEEQGLIMDAAAIRLTGRYKTIVRAMKKRQRALQVQRGQRSRTRRPVRLITSVGHAKDDKEHDEEDEEDDA